MPHFKSFSGLLEEAVLPLLKKHPEWTRLDGAEKSGNRTVFATFQYEYKNWKIHSDTLVAKLLAALELENAGQKPFVEAKTKKERNCLRLSNLKTKGPKRLYIYEN